MKIESNGNTENLITSFLIISKAFLLYNNYIYYHMLLKNI